MNINLKIIVSNSYSYSDILRALGRPVNGNQIKQIKKIIKEQNISTHHFNGGHEKRRKYKKIIKKCPVCGTEFETKLNHYKEKSVCSHACANTYFRTGENHPNWKGNKIKNENKYRRICFENFDKRCYYPGCTWDLVVDVHHIDDNHENNDPYNLIPLCPNHHKLLSMDKYKKKAHKIIISVRDNFWNNGGDEHDDSPSVGS